MVGLAREAGLLSFQTQRRFGGWEPSHREQAVLFEAAGWSTLGPVALNCAAPDEANMYILSRIANPEQTEKFLVPVIEGRQRSVFAMTEPGGAGSDPGQLQTEAVYHSGPAGGEYVINGRKWLITGANGAKTWITNSKHGHLCWPKSFKPLPYLPAAR
jgi:acyl-CoA dehydrogenase